MNWQWKKFLCVGRKTKTLYYNFTKCNKDEKMASQHFLHGYRFNVHGDFNNKHQILFTVWLIDSTGIRIRYFCVFLVDLVGVWILARERCPFFVE